MKDNKSLQDRLVKMRTESPDCYLKLYLERGKSCGECMTWYTHGDGLPWVLRVRDLREEAEQRLSFASISILLTYRERVKEAERNFRNTWGKKSLAIESIHRQINRQIKNLRTMSGLVPTPSVVLRNQTMTRQVLCNGDYQTERGVLAGHEICEEYKAILATRPASLILDGIGTYVSDYFVNGKSENMVFSGYGSDWQAYVIKDTFSSFCKRIGVHGTDRDRVKEALFPPEGRAALLERVKLVLPSGGPHKLFMDIRFISSRRVLTMRHNNLLNNAKEAVLAFEMEINYEMWRFLDASDAIKAKRGKGRAIESFQYVPKALTQKIDQTIETALWVADGYEHEPEIRESLLALKNQRDNLNKCVKYLINKWNTGSQNRKNPMVAPWEELADRGLVAKHDHSTRQHKRGEFIQSLWYVCNHLKSEYETFQSCERIQLANESMTLVFHPSDIRC